MILLAGGLFFWYINPTYTGAITTLNGQIHKYDSALAAAKEFKAKEARLLSERAAISPAALERIETFLPDSVDNVQLILDLDAIAARAGVQLSNFDIKVTNPSNTEGAASGGIAPLALDSGQPVDSLDLSVNATGSYMAFRTFLAATEASLRPLDIVQLALKDSTNGVYTYQITFRIYWLH